jgi:signal transduction histidine kinase
VVQNSNPAVTVYDSPPRHAEILETNADAAAPMLDMRPGMAFERGFDRPFNGGLRGPGPPAFRGGPPPGVSPRDFPPPGARQPSFGPARWRILVRHRAGSLEALVTQTRRRNLAISAAVLALILATIAMLVRFSRQAQRLAELQIGFVAGVSHELRTPLTVIRTCAYNLRSGRFKTRPDQVERYGRLIEAESEKLEALVEQVLRFASAEAGHATRQREAVAIGKLIGEELDSKRSALDDEHIVLEEAIGSDLPMVLADSNALRHALRNLLDNALKYGTKDSRWIGVYVETVAGEKGKAIEIRVADRGPGIPEDEQERIFDAFYRGRRAVEDQVHGTGLGLNLVQKIVQAHGGSIRVKSEPGKGTEFIVRLPGMATTTPTTMPAKVQT